MFSLLMVPLNLLENAFSSPLMLISSLSVMIVVLFALLRTIPTIARIVIITLVYAVDYKHSHS